MSRLDIAVYSAENKLILVAEVRGKQQASSAWVKELRQLLLDASLIPEAQYFLLALPDYFYLWKHPASREAEPGYRIDAKEALARYLEPASLSLEKISGQGLEFLVSAWLRDLTYLDNAKEQDNPDMQWLFESGLYEAIKNGKVQMEVAA